MVVHAGMAAAVPAAVAGLTRPEIADLRCGGAAAGAAVALGRLEQWGRLARRNSGGTVGSVGFGSVGRRRRSICLYVAAAAVHPQSALLLGDSAVSAAAAAAAAPAPALADSSSSM